MNVYDIFMAPLERISIAAIRRRLMPKAHGKILEIGAGTGANLQYYQLDKIKGYTILDQAVSNQIRTRAPRIAEFVTGDATKMPFPDNAFDTVVETLVLCSIEEHHLALQEIERVLKPGGLLLHIDHGLPMRQGLRNFFNLVAPFWRTFTKSCRLNKDFSDILKETGLKTVEAHISKSGIFYWGVLQKIKSEQVV